MLLNAHYAALRVVTVRRAFTLLFKRDESMGRVAEVVSVEDGRYMSYDLDDWVQLSTFRREFDGNGCEWVRTVRVAILVPRIIRVLTYARLPIHDVKFNRRSVLARDDHTCQYCGVRFPPARLTIDHVIPRSQDGGTTWDNIVCACHRCNVRKGGRTPAQAGLRLIRKPVKPKRNPTVMVKLADKRYADWRPFVDPGTRDATSA